MGHQTVHGFVREVRIGGRAFLQVEQPEARGGSRLEGDDREWTVPAVQRIYSTSAVYAITPCTAESVRAAIVDEYAYHGRPGSKDDLPF
jgi:hypothetical protein